MSRFSYFFLFFFYCSQILDTDEEYERFLERSVERARQLLAKDRNGGSFQCARPDCTGWCLIYDKQNVFEFKCPVCQAITCVRCRVSVKRTPAVCILFSKGLTREVEIGVYRRISNNRNEIGGLFDITLNYIIYIFSL